jgi:hypothetical protein
VSFLGVKQVPAAVVPHYRQFFATFVPSAIIDAKTTQAFKKLLALAMTINADMKWVAHL